MDTVELINKIPKIEKREWTYLETLGISSRETIIANLLGYFFNPTERHGLEDTFIKALLQTPSYSLEKKMLTKETKGIDYLKKHKEFKSANIIIEHKTDENKRLDIVIDTDKLVIGIEFKINHELNNPLDTYYSTIKNKYKDKDHYFIVLTPYWKAPIEKALGGTKNTEFVQVMISHFIENVETIVHNETSDDDLGNTHQYYIYQDFINTIDNRTKEFKMKKDLISQVKNNNLNSKELEEAFTALFAMKYEINRKVKDLEIHVSKNSNSHYTFWDKKEKLTAILINDLGEYSIKIRLNPSGWWLEAWAPSHKQIGESIKLTEFDQEGDSVWKLVLKETEGLKERTEMELGINK